MSDADVWTLGGSGNWSVAAHWSLSRAPRRGDDVEIDGVSPSTVSFDGPGVVIGALTLSGAELDLQSGPILAQGAALFQDAIVDGAAALIVAGANTVKGLTLGGSATLYNQGVVTQSSGTTTIGDAAFSKAKIKNAAGASWIIADGSAVAQGSETGLTFINRGLFADSGGAGIVTITADFFSTGTIEAINEGVIAFDGKFNYFSGSFTGAGTIELGSNSFSRIYALTLAQYSLLNNGVVDLVSGLTLSNGSSITNQGKWKLDGDVSLLAAAGDPNVDFNNSGVLAKTSGTGISYVTVNIEPSDQPSLVDGGLLYVETGTLDLEGSDCKFRGAYGPGTLEIGGGYATLIDIPFMGVRHWILAGGVTDLVPKADTGPNNLIYSGDFIGEAGATLSSDIEDLTLTGSATLSGLNVTGGLSLACHTTISGGALDSLIDTDFVEQKGGDVRVGDLQVGRSGVWDIKDASDILSENDFGAGDISIYGLFEKTGLGMSVVQVQVLNLGVNSSATEYRGIKVTAGTLDLEGAVSGNGESGGGNDNIVGAGTLEFGGFVASDQYIYFFGSHGALDLTDLHEFEGAIVGFDTVGSHDALLIGGGYAFAGASVSATAAILSFSLGSTTDTLTLTGDYRGGSFSAQALTGGVQEITF